MSIDDYLEVYNKSKIKYDRMYHINNCGYDFSRVDSSLIKKIFNYIDKVIFNGKLMEYANDNNFKVFFKVSDALKSTAGMFIHSSDKKRMGFKISGKFFQNIIDKNILNIDLSVVDENNKKYLSMHVIEPLFATLEHEIIHMLLFITRNNKLNDYKKVKSGHTPLFKRLVYNIFGHYKISHTYSLGDVKENLNKMKEIKLGDYVKIINKEFFGYVVSMKKTGAILCYVKPDGSTEYSGAFYKELIKIDIDNMINIIDMMKKLRVGKKIVYNKKTYKIIQLNKTTITAELESDDPKFPNGSRWKIPKSRVLDFLFI